MKSFRFASVVEQSGQPEVYLLLVDPKKDADFQRALKEHRVMTLQPGGTGGKTPVGTPGYHAGPRAQVLLFPRALKIPPDAQVVGIKFDLFHAELEPAHQEPKSKASVKPAAKLEHHARSPGSKPEPEKVVPFTGADDDEEIKPLKAAAKPVAETKSSASRDDDHSDKETAALKAGIRRALKALEAGKQVAAFNVLKGLVKE